MATVGYIAGGGTAESGLNYANQVACVLTMPVNGWITNAHVVFGGWNTNPWSALCIWAVNNGGLIWASAGFTPGTGPSQQSKAAPNIRVSGGNSFRLGFWRDPNADAQWTTDTAVATNWAANTVPGGPAPFSPSIAAYGPGQLSAYVDYTANAVPNQGVWQSPTPSGTISDTNPTFSGTTPQNPADAAYESVSQIRWQITRTDTGQTVFDRPWSVNANISSWSRKPSDFGLSLQAGVPYSSLFSYADSWGSWSGWCASPTTFTINAGPNAPTPSAPAGKISAVTGLNFTANYTHGSGLAAQNVQVQVLDSSGTNVLQDSGIVAQSVSSGSNYTVAQWFSGLQWGTPYTWWTRAQDTSGVWGPWSQLEAFNTDAAPGSPILQSPLNGAVIEGGSVVLKAAFSSADGSTLSSVTWDLYDATTGAEVSGYPVTVTGSFASGSSQTRDVTSALTVGHAYAWRAQCSDGTLTGPWSGYLGFTYTTPPSVTVTSPTSGQVEPTASATVQISYSGSAAKAYDRTYLYLSTSTRTNLSTNPSLGTSAAGWSTSNGSPGSLSGALNTSGGFIGSNFYRATVGTAYSGMSNPGWVTAPVGTLTAGQTYTFSAYVRVSVARQIAFDLVVTVPSTVEQFGSYVTIPANTWTRISATWTIPASNTGPVQVRIRPLIGDSNLWGSGQTLDVDAVLIEASSALGSYFDGDTADSATLANQWTSTPELSTSTQIGLGSLVLDSGNVAGTRTMWSLPYSTLQNGKSYAILVQVTDINGLTATSGAIPFSASWMVTSGPRLQLLVDGTDRTVNMEQDQWYITQDWGRQGDTAQVELTDEHGDGVPNFHVRPMATVEVRDLNLGLLLFGGVVTQPNWIRQSPNLTTWRLMCSSTAVYLQNRIISSDYSGWTADAIVHDMLAQANCGITGNHVSPGPIIDSFKGLNHTVAQALQKLCHLASITSTYGWWVDGNSDLHFASTTQADAQPSGVTLTDTVTAPATTTQGYYQNDTQTYYQWDASSLKTRVLVQGGAITRTTTEQFVGDGTTRSFRLSYPVQTSPLSATVLVNGAASPVSADSAATTPWVLVQGAPGVWSLSTQPGGQPPASGAIVAITYSYVMPVIAQVQSGAGVAAVQGPNQGLFDTLITDSTLTGLEPAQARALREIEEYALPQERVVLTTTEDWQGWLNVGQSFQFVNSLIPDSQNNWAAGINDTFLCIQMRASGVAGGYRTLQITAVRI